MQHNFSKKKLFSFSVYLLAQISVKNFFSKREYIRIKLRIYSQSLNKSLTENFISFCREYYWPCKFFFKPNCQSSHILYINQHLTQINIQYPLQKSILALEVNNSIFTLDGA